MSHSQILTENEAPLNLPRHFAAHRHQSAAQRPAPSRHRLSVYDNFKGAGKLTHTPEDNHMQVNDIVENFTLQNQDGKEVSLTDFKGKPVVLFFYPRADTPGCTIESCGFRDAFEKFQKAGIVVLGISRDTVSAQKKFKDKYSLPYDLLADPNMVLINRYDLIKPKNMYGKLVKGVKRTTYLIGPDQRLIHIFDEVKPEGHAEEVLALLKQKPKGK
jgi:peroxiredoxin Q/BCP